jgi:Repeat of unknown function (DUF5648)
LALPQAMTQNVACYAEGFTMFHVSLSRDAGRGKYSPASRVAIALLAFAFAHAAGAQVARSCSLPTGSQEITVLPDGIRITQERVLASPLNPQGDIALYLALGAPIAAHALNGGSFRYAVLSYPGLVDLDPILWQLQDSPGFRYTAVGQVVCPATRPPFVSAPVQVYELHSKRWDTYYYLLTDFEYRLLKKATATTDADWEWTDETFFAEATGNYCSDYLPVHRLEYRGADGYFNQYYTQDLQVCGQAKSVQGLVSRGQPFWALPADFSWGNPCALAAGPPVYRLYNNREAQARPNHRYTTRRVLADQLVAQGWTNEGIGFCAAGY